VNGSVHGLIWSTATAFAYRGKEYHSVDNWCSKIWIRDLRLRSRSDKLETATLAHMSINTTLRRRRVETIRTILPVKLQEPSVQAFCQLTPSVKTPSVSGRWKHVHVAIVCQPHLSRHYTSLIGESMYMLRPSVNTIYQNNRRLLQVKACTCSDRLSTRSIKTRGVSYRWKHVHVPTICRHHPSGH
jgi:hypothetical protein